jgi:preprotein translocase SecE subunit
MADKPPAKPKRLVKNPETFRERAIKASEASGQVTRTSRLKGAGSQVTSPILKPVGNTFGKVFAFKPIALLGKIIFPVYFRQSWRELRLVTWPNWKESRQLTYAVLVFAVIFGIAIAVVDYGLDKIFKHVLLK